MPDKYRKAFVFNFNYGKGLQIYVSEDRIIYYTIVWQNERAEKNSSNMHWEPIESPIKSTRVSQ